jgi:HSF-type DNA-binding
MKNEDDDDRKRESTRTPESDGRAGAPESPSPTKRPKTEVGAAAAANDDAIVAASKGSNMTRSTTITKRDCGASGGRVRLPEKLLKYLNHEPMPDVIWWMPDGNGFAYNIETVQEKFLDICFQGTKLSSFVRSLNRW